MSIKGVVSGVIGACVRIIILALLVMFVYKTSLRAYEFGYRVFAEPPVAAGTGWDVDVTIPMGKGASGIGEILEEKGLIRDKSLFYFQELLSAYHGKLQPGFYTLNTSMTAEQMMEIMAAGKSDEDEKDGEDS